MGSLNKGKSLGAVMLLSFLFLCVTWAYAYDLTGAWEDDNGITYCVKQVGNQLFWNMNDLPRVHNVFYGVIAGDYVTGQWADLPGGQQTGSGTLTVHIESNDRFVKIDESANYLGVAWTRVQESRCAEATKAQSIGTGAGKAGPSGMWAVTWTDPYAYYKVRWEIIPKGEGVWEITSTLLETNHSYNSRYVGQTESGGILQEQGPGKFLFLREGASSNPTNPDFYRQTATLTFDGSDAFSGEGTHEGSKITHWIRIEGNRIRD
jgi:hypothetical protein